MQRPRAESANAGSVGVEFGVGGTPPPPPPPIKPGEAGAFKAGNGGTADSCDCSPTLPVIEYDEGAKSGDDIRPPPGESFAAVSGSVARSPAFRCRRRPLDLRSPLTASQTILSGMMCRFLSRMTSGTSSCKEGSSDFCRKMRRAGECASGPAGDECRRAKRIPARSSSRARASCEVGAGVWRGVDSKSEGSFILGIVGTGAGARRYVTFSTPRYCGTNPRRRGLVCSSAS